MRDMRRWLAHSVAAMAVISGLIASPALPAPPAAAAVTPIGKLGDVLRIDYMGIVADVAVTAVDLSEIPPGFGRAPLGPRYEVYRGNVNVHIVKAPNPFITSIVFSFRGVTPIADAYQPRNSDSPDALQYALHNAPPGASVSGGVWWDVYRDLITNVVLLDKVTGTHLAQWNLN